VSRFDRYLHSIHATPAWEDASKINATCYDCHDAHNIGPAGSLTRAEARLKNPWCVASATRRRRPST